MSSKHNIFSDVLSVIIFSVVVFLVIFFLYPDISMKYFGVAAKPNQVFSKALESSVNENSYLSSDEKAKINSYLESAEAKKLMQSVSEAASKGGEALEKTMQSPEFKKFTEEVGSSLSKEKLEKFVGDITSTASNIYSKVDK